MRKLSVILMAVCVFAIISYSRKAHAEYYYERLIDELVDYVIKNGVKDSDCRCDAYECYEFFYEIVSQKDNFVERVEIKIQQKKKEEKRRLFKKFKKEETQKDKRILIVNIFHKEEKSKKVGDIEMGKVVMERAVNFMDKDGDGILDEMDYIQKEDGVIFCEVHYKKGGIKGIAVQAGLLKDTWTPKNNQDYFEDYLTKIRELTKVD